MPMMPPTFRTSRAPTQAERQRQSDQRRGSAQARGYDTRWTKARDGHLRRSPICRYCELGVFGEPCVTAATVVDHFWPHGGDRALFWLTRFWVSSCKPCHDGPKQAVERKGRAALAALARLMGIVPHPGG